MVEHKPRSPGFQNVDTCMYMYTQGEPGILSRELHIIAMGPQFVEEKETFSALFNRLCVQHSVCMIFTTPLARFMSDLHVPSPFFCSERSFRYTRTRAQLRSF